MVIAYDRPFQLNDFNLVNTHAVFCVHNAQVVAIYLFLRTKATEWWKDNIYSINCSISNRKHG